MTIEQLSQWMLHPHQLGKEQVPELRELCEQFPYFSISKMLLTKSLQNTNDVLFETEVRTTATYCHDRRKLFFLLYPLNADRKPAIPDTLLNDFPGESFTSREEASIAVNGLSLKSLAQKLKEARIQVKQQEAIEPPAPSVIEENNEAEAPPEKIETLTVDATPASSMMTDTSDYHANAQESTVSATPVAPVSPTSLESGVVENAAKEETQPTVKETSQTVPGGEAMLVYTEEEAIRLIKAKEYEKAVKILRVLHLNIPEKSVYFADQIRYLEKIIATFNKS